MEFRCEKCNKKLAEWATKGTIIRCPRCHYINKMV